MRPFELPTFWELFRNVLNISFRWILNWAQNWFPCKCCIWCDGGKSRGLNYRSICMSVRESLIITWWEEKNVFISFNSEQSPWCTVENSGVQWGVQCTVYSGSLGWDWEGPSVVACCLTRTHHDPPSLSPVNTPRVIIRLLQPPSLPQSEAVMLGQWAGETPRPWSLTGSSSTSLSSPASLIRIPEQVGWITQHKNTPPARPGHCKYYTVSQSVKLLSMIWWGPSRADICYLIPLCHFLSIYKLKQKPHQ